jgi:hypothetical protein
MGGSMLGNGIRTTLETEGKLVKGRAYCKSSIVESFMEKYFGGA